MYLPGSIHERIGDLRTSRGLQQKELAELVGISPSQISRIETGESKNITADTIAKLAKALQCLRRLHSSAHHRQRSEKL